jgi:uncharacterized protein with von Willebrand factor type A (vWA) domain
MERKEIKMFLKSNEKIYRNSVLNADAFDKRRFNELLKLSKGLQKLKENGENEFPYFSQLMGDIWSSFYKTKPRLLEEEEILSELKANHSFMGKIMSDEGFKQTKKTTTFDDVSSALFTVYFGEKVLEWIKEIKEKNKEFEKAINNMQNLQQEQEGDQQLINQINQMNEILQNELSSSNIQEMIKQGIKETNEQKNSLKDLLNGIGAGTGNGDFELQKMPTRERIALAEKLKDNKKIKKIAEWAGRFKQIARSKQKVKHKESVERSGISMGNEVERILPIELSMQSFPTAKLDFLRRFAEGQVMLYDKKGKDVLGKGPIVLCLDQSGSMRTLELQSKGFALAIMAIAKKQKRDFAYIPFSTSAKVHLFKKGKISVKEMTEIAESFKNGGTNFYHPLKKALNLIIESRFKDADIIFVTDGDATLPYEFIEKFNKVKRQKKFGMKTILIGFEAKDESLKPVSDEIIHANDFMEADKAFEI